MGHIPDKRGKAATQKAPYLVTASGETPYPAASPEVFRPVPPALCALRASGGNYLGLIRTSSAGISTNADRVFRISREKSARPARRSAENPYLCSAKGCCGKPRLRLHPLNLMRVMPTQGKDDTPPFSCSTGADERTRTGRNDRRGAVICRPTPTWRRAPPFHFNS